MRVERLSDVCPVSLQERRGGRHLHFLGDAAHLHGDVVSGDLVYQHGNRIGNRPLESSRLNRDLILSGNELPLGVVTGFVGRHVRLGALLDVGDGYLGVGDSGTGGVSYSSHDTAKNLLCAERLIQAEQRERNADGEQSQLAQTEHYSPPFMYRKNLTLETVDTHAAPSARPSFRIGSIIDLC